MIAVAITISPNVYWFPIAILIVGTALGILSYGASDKGNKGPNLFLILFLTCLLTIFVYAVPVYSYVRDAERREKQQQTLAQLHPAWQKFVSTVPVDSVVSSVIWKEFYHANPPQISIEQYTIIRDLIPTKYCSQKDIAPYVTGEKQ